MKLISTLLHPIIGDSVEVPTFIWLGVCNAARLKTYGINQVEWQYGRRIGTLLLGQNNSGGVKKYAKHKGKKKESSKKKKHNGLSPQITNSYQGQS